MKFWCCVRNTLRSEVGQVCEFRKTKARGIVVLYNAKPVQRKFVYKFRKSAYFINTMKIHLTGSRSHIRDFADSMYKEGDFCCVRVLYLSTFLNLRKVIT